MSLKKKGTNKLDKVVIITGISGGIGKEVARRVAGDGFFVLGTYSSSKKEALKTKEEIDSSNGKCEIIKVDVRNEDEVKDLVKKATESGILYGVVNNAGITADGLVLKMESKTWKRVLDINLHGAFLLTRESLKVLLRNKEGSIINISSIVGIYGNPGQSNYAASKAGLIGFTKSVAKEVGSRNIRVNAIAPGFIETKMTERLGKETKEKVINNTPLRRLGKPQEVASTVSFLLSDDSSFITGTVIEVSGGLIV